jgi:hypothetical protein
MQSIGRASVLTAIGVLSALAACDPSGLLGPEAAQGIEGIALIGPQCPVQSEEEPCPDLPYEVWITVRRVGGGNVGRFRTGSDGRFRVGLHPGRYLLDPESGDPFPVGSSQEVEVSGGTYTEVVIQFDTGIR